MTKISALTPLGDGLAVGDQFIIRDIDDAVTPNKSVTISGITRGLDRGTNTAPAIAFAADKNTGIYSPGEDQLAVATNGTEKLIVLSNGNVGIGTSSPSSLVHIAGGGTGRRGALRFSDSGGANYWEIGRDNGVNGSFTIAQNGTERLCIDYLAGNVGIGTTTPSIPLQVLNAGTGNNTNNGAISLCRTSTVGSTLYHMYSTAVSDEAFAFSVHGGTTFSDTTYTKYLASVGGVHVWYGATNATERARIDSSGRLLVGTSSTSANSTLVLQGASGGANAVIRPCRSDSSPGSNDQIGMIAFGDSSQRDLAYFFCARDGGTWTAGSSQPTSLVFSTTADEAASPTERMRIRSDGASLYHSAANNGISLGITGSSGTSNRLFSGGHSASSIGVYTETFLVWSNGDVQNTNNSYGAISDAKLKENIVDANSQWDDLKALQVRNYNFKEGQTHTQIGLVAQEVELVSPGLVNESPDRDAEGNDLGTVTKSVNYSVLYMKAVKALQEAMERIEQLEARLTAAGIE